MKAPRHWPLCGEFTGYRWIPAQRASTGKMFPLDDVIMTRAYGNSFGDRAPNSVQVSSIKDWPNCTSSSNGHHGYRLYCPCLLLYGICQFITFWLLLRWSNNIRSQEIYAINHDNNDGATKFDLHSYRFSQFSETYNKGFRLLHIAHYRIIPLLLFWSISKTYCHLREIFIQKHIAAETTG